jgi:hypothetical protein
MGVTGKIMTRRLSPPLATASPTMPLFWKPYRSDATNFIEQMKAKRPNLEAEQRAGRSLLWDRAQDREALTEWRDAQVAQQPYVYQTKS